MTESFIVLNTKGGVGKTTVATALAHVYHEQHDQWPRLVEVDAQRLSTVSTLPVSVCTISPQTGIENLEADPELAAERFGPLYDALVAGDCVVDIGANTAQPVLEWANLSGIPDGLMAQGIVPHFLFVTTLESQSLGAAVNDHTHARRVFGTAARYSMVFNRAKPADFEPFQGVEISEVLRQAQDDGTDFVYVPNLWGRVFDHVESRNRLPIDAYREFDSCIAEMGLNLPDANRQRKRVDDWMQGVRAALAPVVSRSSAARTGQAS